MAEKILNRLGFDIKFVSLVSYLVKMHDTPILKEEVENLYDISLIRYKIQECDALAHNPTKLEKRKEYLEKTKKMFKK